MAETNIDAFKAKLTGGGARSNMFNVICNFPAFAQGDSELASFMIKAVQFPSAVINPIPVLWRGRQYQEQGDRTYEPITITVINDTGMEVRNAFERWSNGINEFRNNKSDFTSTDIEADMLIQQLSRNGDVSKEYKVISCWPSNISSIELSADSENTIQEFTVELQYTRWETPGITT